MSVAFAPGFEEKIMEAPAETSSPRLHIDFDGVWDVGTQSCLESALRTRIGEPPAGENWSEVATSFGNFCLVLLRTSLQTHYSFCAFTKQRVASSTSQPALGGAEGGVAVAKAPGREVSEAFNALGHALMKPKRLTTRERTDLLRKLCEALSD